jgi:membrane fusion protein (multidrug efflux system)
MSHAETPSASVPAQNPAENKNEEESIESVPLYRKGKIVIPLILLFTAMAVAGWYWYLNEQSMVSTDDAFIDGNRATVSSKILGRIDQLMVDEGDSIVAGQVLVRLDQRDLRAQEEQARAALALAQENTNLSQVGLDKAAEDYQRAEMQFKDKIIPKEQFDHALKDYESERVRQSVSLAQVATARAQLGVITTELQNTTIVSSIKGVVSKRWVLAGDIAQPGQPILSIYDLKDVWVTANVEETKLSLLHPNQEVEISVDTYSSLSFRGKILQLGSNTAAQFSLIPPNNASGNFTKITQRIPVKISIEPQGLPDPKVHLLPGMSVEIKIKLK